MRQGHAITLSFLLYKTQCKLLDLVAVACFYFKGEDLYGCIISLFPNISWQREKNHSQIFQCILCEYIFDFYWRLITLVLMCLISTHAGGYEVVLKVVIFSIGLHTKGCCMLLLICQFRILLQLCSHSNPNFVIHGNKHNSVGFLRMKHLSRFVVTC